MIKNAKETDYRIGSEVHMYNKVFQRLYNKLLGSLHKAFNGQKEQFINAKFLMYAVDYYARRMVKLSINRKISPHVGPTAAPIFKWIKTEISNIKTASYLQKFHSPKTAMKIKKMLKKVPVPQAVGETKITETSESHGPTQRKPKTKTPCAGHKHKKTRKARIHQSHRRRYSRRRRFRERGHTREEPSRENNNLGEEDRELRRRYQNEFNRQRTSDDYFIHKLKRYIEERRDNDPPFDNEHRFEDEPRFENQPHFENQPRFELNNDNIDHSDNRNAERDYNFLLRHSNIRDDAVQRNVNEEFDD